MNLIKENWFTEFNDQWSGQAFSLEIDEILYSKKSEFQDVLLFKSKKYGRVLVLDGVIQLTEKDEFTYQEMMACVPLNCHPDPRRVLIVGGGDGGVAREVLKDPRVESVVLCDIDKDVIEVSKKFLPFMSVSLDDPKLELFIGDGCQYVRDHPGSFDVIITDSSDPIGPAQVLFERPYYQDLKAALRTNGVLCSQGESVWLDLELIQSMVGFCSDIFPVVEYAVVQIPSYPCGQIGLVVCSLNKSNDVSTPLAGTMPHLDKFRYYSPAVHKAAFALPRYFQTELDKFNKTKAKKSN